MKRLKKMQMNLFHQAEYVPVPLTDGKVMFLTEHEMMNGKATMPDGMEIEIEYPHEVQTVYIHTDEDEEIDGVMVHNGSVIFCTKMDMENGYCKLPDGRIMFMNQEEYEDEEDEMQMAEGKWVTINGSPVYIENGVVTKGAKRLIGKKPKKVGSLLAGSKSQSRKELNRLRGQMLREDIDALEKKNIERRMEVLSGRLL